MLCIVALAVFQYFMTMKTLSINLRAAQELNKVVDTVAIAVCKPYSVNERYTKGEGDTDSEGYHQADRNTGSNS